MSTQARVRWETAQLDWTPDGYRLTVGVDLSERAVPLLSRSLDRMLPDLPGLASRTGSQPSHTLYQGTGSGLQPSATLILDVPDTLFDVEADRFRRFLDSLVQHADQRARAQQQREDTDGREWLRQLRGR